FHESVAFVHQDHGRKFAGTDRISEQRGHSVLAGNVLARDVSHALSFGAGRASERGNSAEESKFREEFTPWRDCHGGPPSHLMRILRLIAMLSSRTVGEVGIRRPSSTDPGSISPLLER